MHIFCNVDSCFSVQILSGIIACSAALSPGMTLGFSAVALPQIAKANGNPLIDKHQLSWIGEYIHYSPLRPIARIASHLWDSDAENLDSCLSIIVVK